MKPSKLPNASAKAALKLQELGIDFNEIEFPTLPDKPDLPSMPDLPDIADLPDLPDLPNEIDVPMAPDLPDLSLPEQAQDALSTLPVDFFDFG